MLVLRMYTGEKVYVQRTWEAVDRNSNTSMNGICLRLYYNNIYLLLAVSITIGKEIVNFPNGIVVHYFFPLYVRNQ